MLDLLEVQGRTPDAKWKIKTSGHPYVEVEADNNGLHHQVTKDSSWSSTTCVIVDRSTKSAYFVPIKESSSTNILVEIYIKEVVSQHGAPV